MHFTTCHREIHNETETTPNRDDLGAMRPAPWDKVAPVRHGCDIGTPTLALGAGVHPKVVQERLGHANISITLDTYSHVTAALHGDAAEKLSGLIFGGPLAAC
jgi:hypothetical protein